MRRRRLAALATASALLMLALLAYKVIDQRGGVNHPADWFTNTHGVKRVHETVQSKALNGRAMAVDVLLPPDYEKSDHRPLLIFLHGRGTSDEHLSNSAITKALTKAGRQAPIVALPYGDEASYWHDRSTGEWDTYVAREVVAEVARKYGADRRRMAIGGISMGGYGAYNIARLHPGRFCAVGGHSPAFWQTAGETAAGAFDDAEDFARNNVVGTAQTNPAAYIGPKLWIDAGDEDPFQPGDQVMIKALRAAGADLTAKTWPGGHDEAYWDAHYDAYMRFYSRALARCS